MLASWFERGLGQIVAPDEKHAAKASEEGEETEEGFWSIVAPDPNFEKTQRSDETPSSSLPPKTPSSSIPPSSFLSPPPTNKVQCEHCKQYTPVASTTPANTAPASSDKTPLDGRVLSAAKDTTVSMMSPPSVAEARNKVFRLCASSKPLSSKLCDRLKRLLQKDPQVISARASKLGNLVADGFTPLMAAASVNNVAAAQIILEQAPDAVLEVDLQGRTALHIAAEMGCMEMVEFLRQKYPEGPNAPLDLAGHTPLGRAVTSNHQAAKQQRGQLQDKLFSPGDVSVCGKPTPAKERSSQLNLELVYGYADMPGLRVTMEDAISCHAWRGHALLGVCDGHGDQGLVSDFCATHVGDLLQEQLEASSEVEAAWKTTCLELDAQLKETKRVGGSTAVWALVTQESIVCANVGDSRCILVQKAPSLEEAMEKLKIKEDKKDDDEKEEDQDASKETEESEVAEEAAAEEPTVSPTQGGCVVVPLSEDHKPNLQGEQARVEHAGLSVVAETYMEDGQEHTIHKVQRSETDRLAVSRSFGDFEYKGNTELSAEEQAVVAVPEVRVHARDHDRDMFLVLCCDGVWDVMSSQEVGDFVVKHAQDKEEDDVLPRVGDLLLNECLQRGSTDNMTCVIAALSKTAASLNVSPALKGKTLEYPDE